MVKKTTHLPRFAAGVEDYRVVVCLDFHRKTYSSALIY